MILYLIALQLLVSSIIMFGFILYYSAKRKQVYQLLGQLRSDGGTSSFPIPISWLSGGLGSKLQTLLRWLSLTTPLPSPEEIQKLSKSIKYNAEADSYYWNIFLPKFNLQHYGFFDRLEQKHGQLLFMDKGKKLCAFIRAGLNDQEIANLLSVKTDVIKKTKARLKIKLGLDKEHSLSHYLKNL